MNNHAMEFVLAPPVPISYPRLRALKPEELAAAVRAGYVAKDPTPSRVVSEDGEDARHVEIGTGIDDWRNRMFLVWFCYLIENFKEIRMPLSALEDILLEFQGGPLEFDADNRRLATLYAGAAAGDPIGAAERERELRLLHAYYNKLMLRAGRLAAVTRDVDGTIRDMAAAAA